MMWYDCTMSSHFNMKLMVVRSIDNRSTAKLVDVPSLMTRMTSEMSIMKNYII